MKTAKNEKGFSIPSMMVAVGILGIIAVATAQLMTSSFQLEKRLNQSFEANNLVNRIRMVLADTDNCAATLAPTGTPISLPAVSQVIKLPNTSRVSIETPSGSTPVVQVGQDLDYGMTLGEMQLSEPQLVSDNGGNQIHIVDLVFVFESGVKAFAKKIPLSVEVDTASNNITACSSSENGLASRSPASGDPNSLGGPCTYVTGTRSSSSIDAAAPFSDPNRGYLQYTMSAPKTAPAGAVRPLLRRFSLVMGIYRPELAAHQCLDGQWVRVGTGAVGGW